MGRLNFRDRGGLVTKGGDEEEEEEGGYDDIIRITIPHYIIYSTNNPFLSQSYNRQ